MKKKLQIISFLIIFFFIVSSEETINDSTDPNPKDIEPIETLEKTDEPSETDDIASDIEETQMNYSEYDVMSDAIPHEDEHEDDEDEDEEIYNTSYPTNDEGEQSITNKPGPSDEFIMEWEKVMGNFVPEDITTFKIEAGGTEVFYFFFSKSN